ncbi:hypothetical protein ILYODFUR_006656 [Ilyodon furcidens]|uniref:Uncharacterized protein n=1 Tax=Ilyodon furcidens TaxID=33524 RepID=A0ABV0THX3_9TELE
MRPVAVFDLGAYRQVPRVALGKWVQEHQIIECKLSVYCPLKKFSIAFMLVHCSPLLAAENRETSYSPPQSEIILIGGRRREGLTQGSIYARAATVSHSISE